MPASGPGAGRAPLDLRAFAPGATTTPARWSHAIRRLDGRGRVPLPEVEALAGEEGAVVATLAADRWELRPAGRGVVVLDGRKRVVVPLGVRHRLGLAGGVLVSLALDGSLLVLTPVSGLDALVERR